MSSKNILLYVTLCIFINPFQVRSLWAGEDLENLRGRNHKRELAKSSGMTSPSILRSAINPFPEPTPSSWRCNPTIEKIEHPHNKQPLKLPIELCAMELYKILQKKPTKVQGLLATLIKEENASTLAFSKKSNISAVSRHEIAKPLHQNPLANTKKNKNLRVEKIYDLYQGEDLIKGTYMEICFTWPKKEPAIK